MVVSSLRPVLPFSSFPSQNFLIKSFFSMTPVLHHRKFATFPVLGSRCLLLCFWDHPCVERVPPTTQRRLRSSLVSAFNRAGYWRTWKGYGSSKFVPLLPPSLLPSSCVCVCVFDCVCSVRYPSQARFLPRLGRLRPYKFWTVKRTGSQVGVMRALLWLVVTLPGHAELGQIFPIKSFSCD